MKLSFIVLFSISFLNSVIAQKTDFKIGIESEVKIELIDKKLQVFENLQNSIFRFKIINNSNDSIFIPSPSNLCGNTPQFFDLHNEKVECMFENCEMQTRPLEDFILVNPKSDKIFELTSDFFINSCVFFGKPSTAVLRYSPQKHLEKFIKTEYSTEDYIKVFRNLLYSIVESEEIQIVYK